MILTDILNRLAVEEEVFRDLLEDLSKLDLEEVIEIEIKAKEEVQDLKEIEGH